jgi:hypothetical protein
MPSVVHSDRNLDTSVLVDDFDEKSVVDSSFSFGDFQLTGHGSVTNDNCGKFRGYYGCLHTELHDKIALDGTNFKDKIFAHKVFLSCDKPSCPVCYKYGWAVREAHKIEVRLAETSKHWGLPEHIIATFPPKYYHLTYEQLRAKAVKILMARGVVGGVLIWHAGRYNKCHVWYWSPHFHVLGFILGGYSRCRSCKKTCFKGCGGWEDRKYRAFEKDGCIVRVLDKRKTVGGTAWYQLNHAFIKKGVKRFHVAIWFGVCSYRKLKVTPEVRKHLCPICQSELVMIDYSGVKRDSDFERDSVPFLKEGGRVVWSVVVKPSFYRDSIGGKPEGCEVKYGSLC